MKDQYFGDARDYFKYQLLEGIMTCVPTLKRLVCLWMLTPPDDSGQGNVPLVETANAPQLASFLQRCSQVGIRRVQSMRHYFGGRAWHYLPWGDEPPYFHADWPRQLYFGGIPSEYLEDALVFFDPDIGLTDRRPSAKHLSFKELASVHRRMDPDSVAVIYQHRWRRRGFWEFMATEISNTLGGPVLYIAEPAVAFFIAPREGMQERVLESALARVAAFGSSRIVGSTGYV